MASLIRPALLVLLACAPVARYSAEPPAFVSVEAPPAGGCTTPCGLRAYLTALECVRLAEFEALVLAAFNTHVPRWHPAAACRALSGWELRVRTDGVDPKNGSWHTPGIDWPVIGLCQTEKRIIWVSSRSWPGSALAHELAHAVGIGVDGETTLSQFHTEWCGAVGIARAIEAVSWIKETQCRPGWKPPQ